jgi:hypothetical protein
VNVPKSSRFAMVSQFREHAAETPAPTFEVTAPAPEGIAEPTRGRGGKSSSASFDKTTLYLDKQVKLAAQRRLLGTEEDMSTLITRLLSEWLDV